MINLDDKKLKEQIGFHYLLTEILLFILIFIGIEYNAKSKINQLLTIYLEYKIMMVDFFVSLS